MLLGAPNILWGHQPVMDMAPRWKGGYGFQTRVERNIFSRLEKDGASVANPDGLRSESLSIWFEGVYTFYRGFRVTYKAPWVNKKERKFVNGRLQDLSESGLGDVILALQNKYYFNRETYTGNFSLTPSVSLPTGSTSGELALGRGTADYGLSLSLSVEAYYVYTLIDLFSRWNTRGDNGVRKGNTIGFDFDLGIHPYHSNQKNMGIFLMSGFNLRQLKKDLPRSGRSDLNSGGRTLEIVPTIVFYRDNWMWRTQYHIPIQQRLNGTQLTETNSFQTGIGVAFQSFKPF